MGETHAALNPMMTGTSRTRDTRSVVLFQLIRAKLVEYNESLVRQLVDEREAVRAAAASVAQMSEHRKEDGGRSRIEPKKKESVLADGGAGASVQKQADNGQSIVRAGCTPLASRAIAEKSEQVMGEQPCEEIVLKKRRLAEAQVHVEARVEMDRSPVKKDKDKSRRAPAA
uniref:Uncharacterized protein n=1 Tax=Peronospora matthiolae TaxID=2874970 RepID=A0AAV1TAU5_9STRA